ncbi:MAG: preprotein translocase subunit YajC [Desulfobacca sp.]|uniref:preprotein translocase subunit YajC n=1 Tax=Desulfobacca sp. TaxID=2067990 RepID=UPI00404A0F80
MIDVAYAMAGGSGEAAGGGGLLTILPLILMFGIFYVLLIRPQQKKAKEHRNFLENLKRGDRVVTAGGLYGEITGLSDQTVTLEIADKIRVKVGRGYIAAFAPKEGAKSGGNG